MTTQSHPLLPWLTRDSWHLAQTVPPRCRIALASAQCRLPSAYCSKRGIVTRYGRVLLNCAREQSCKVPNPATSFVLTPQWRYLPLHRGGRFSKNDVTPSRKSSVVRMRAFSSTAAPI